jgi:hypothetical protein
MTLKAAQMGGLFIAGVSGERGIFSHAALKACRGAVFPIKLMAVFYCSFG